MATKKATASKKKTSNGAKTTAKTAVKNTKKEPAVIVEKEVVEIVEVVEKNDVCVAADATSPKMSMKEKFAALRPGALIAEFLGTFVLAGAVINLATNGLTGQVGIALIFAVLVMVLGVVSGAHLNPAITIAKYANRKIDGVRAVFYLVAQVLGAIAAFFVLYTIWQSSLDSQVITALAGQGISKDQIETAGGLAQFLTQYSMTVADAAKQLGVSFIDVSLTSGQELSALFSELMGAIVFGLGIGYVTFTEKKCKLEAGLVVGFSLLAGLVIGGASVILNPAIAGAVQAFVAENPFTAGLSFWWPVFVYVGATVIGVTIGVTAYRFILKDALSK
jgi:aquaporin Z